MAVACVLLAGAQACRSEESGAPDPTTTVTSVLAPVVPTAIPRPPTTPAPTVGTVTLRARGVRLANSEESDNAFRAVFDSGAADVSVVLTGVPRPNQVVFVCPAPELDRRVPSPGCRTPAAGETVIVPHGSAYKGVEVVQVGLAGSGPAAGSIVVEEIAISYAPSSRAVRLRLPPLRQGEGGGTPSFRLSPAGPGTYRATATWGAAAGGGSTAELSVAVGTNVLARTDGPPGSLVNGDVFPPAEGTLTVRNTSSTALTGLTIDALFP